MRHWVADTGVVSRRAASCVRDQGEVGECPTGLCGAGRTASHDDIRSHIRRKLAAGFWEPWSSASCMAKHIEYEALLAVCPNGIRASCLGRS